ncbi:MAG: lipid-A-disaccharide synthase [Prevotella sp.]|nr:lipid-A-disaccharide synthase [Prevotella sp.]MBQ9670664.1 lipid-A-disaccharide synthase [Prevotella sp.]
MKYYIIAGEASGDLHASRLMRELQRQDMDAEFRFFGGDMMAAEGGTRVRHYKDMAYMGFIPVLLHLPTILRNMSRCKEDIRLWHPDVCILVDYPGFNLSIAKYLHKHTDIPVFYYIAPKLWAWKEYRIKNMKRDVDELFSILPFEKDFFEGKHGYPIHYVGNPTADEVREFRAAYNESFNDFACRNGLDADKKIIALLAGSRRQEIKDNLPAMIEACAGMDDCQIVIAGAPSVEREYYNSVVEKTGLHKLGSDVMFVDNRTYELLSHATVALVTSGTATLETVLFGVPQVVCYETPLPKIIGYLRKKVLKVRYISLVNLIADDEVVPELVADSFSVDNIRRHLLSIMPGTDGRERQMRGYETICQRLGDDCAPENAARIISELLAD